MKQNKLILPIVATLAVSCATHKTINRVRISQPNMETKKDTSYHLPQMIKWTDEKGQTRIVTQAERDSITGEEITTVQLSEITVTAKSKQVAERNGKINLDFLITVPSSLINNKWQLQLAPVAFQVNDTIELDKIFLSGADFSKMQKKGYLQYQAFLSSIIPDSLYLKEMFNQKGYKRAMEELENEYYQAWKNEVIQKERWIDWSDKINARFAYFNFKVDQNRASIAGYNSILRYLPAYSMYRQLDKEYTPSKWKIYAEGNYQIRTKNITSEDSIAITKKFTNYKKIADNQKKKEMLDEMYNKYVRFPIQSARLDTIIKEGNNFIYYYKQELPATENCKKIELTLNGQTLSKNETVTPLPPSDTLVYYISSMVQFLDHTPRYKKKIISRKDEVNVTAYVNYKSSSTTFEEEIGSNKKEIDKVFETIKNINYTGEFLIDSIYMTATSSPEGSSIMNLQLSKGRAINLKKYLQMPLAEFFREIANKELECKVSGFSSEARKALLTHSWPGNVRELRQKIMGAVLQAQTGLVTKEHLELGITETTSVTGFSLRNDEEDKERIIRALKQADGNRKVAAELLGIGRTTLYNKLEEYGLKYKFEQP